MEVRPSVRNEVSQFFFNLSSLPLHPTTMSTRFNLEIWMRTDGSYWMKSFYLSLKWKYQCKMSVCTECHGWTDKFQLFQFSFSSVAYSQVSLSVRYGGPEPKKKLTDKRHRNTDPIGGNIKRDRWHIQEQTCRTITAHAMQCNGTLMQCNVMQYNVMHAIQCNAMQCNTMYVMEVRPSAVEWSHHYFFFIFKIQNDKTLLKPGFELRTSLKWKSECTDGRTYREVILPLAKMEISM
jgi:hypothetical protein